MAGTVKLHRVFKSPPERVFRAFTDPSALAKWLPPYGFTGTVHEMDVRVGGYYRMSFTNFSAGGSHAFGGKYLVVDAPHLLKYNDQFEDPNLPGQIVVTIEFKQVMCGTELHVLQEGIPDVIPVEMCYLGWQESLDQLQKLIEPEIPANA